MLKFLRRIFPRKETTLTHALSIHLSAQPDVKECATAMRLLFIIAGPDTFAKAVDELPDVPGLADVAVKPPSIESAGFGAAPPAPPAPGVTPAPPPAAGSVELDANGLPWDERIHASTKTKKQDGSWKRKSGIEDSLVESVTTELRATYPAPAPATPAAPPAPPPAGLGDIPTSLDRRTPAAPPAPPPAPPAGSSAPEQPTDFSSFMRLSGAFFAGGKLTMADVNALTMELTGSPSPIELKKRDDAKDWWPVLWASVQEKVAGK
jgi:hypothetical protein